MAKVRYYADDADRRYGRYTRQAFDSVSEAVRAADALRTPSAIVEVRTDDGVLIPATYWDLADRTADGDRVVRHEWGRDGLTGWAQAPVSLDGAQAFTLAVQGRRARVTPSAGAGTSANYRTWFLRENTRWPDSEIKTLWWGPNLFTDSGVSPVNRPQMGHVHGAYVGEDGRMRGAVVWSNIFGASPSGEALLMNTWESNFTALALGTSTGNGGSMDAVGRSATVLWANRFAFGDTFLDMKVSPPHVADGVVAGGIGDLSGMAATGLNGTDLTIQGNTEGQALIRLVASGGALTDPIAGGVWMPDYPGRVWPYWVWSRWVPPVLTIKQWAYGRAEPPLGAPHTWQATLSVNPGVTAEIPTGPGLCGLVGAHAHSASWMEYGDVQMARAGAL